MRILVAEDDPSLAEVLVQSLRRAGYAVDCVKNGDEADAALAANQFDLLILDLGLPRKSGLDVLRRLRSRRSATPVLILTARDSVNDRVAGLDAGADDYLPKPFELAELEARVRALARRGMAGGATLIRHGPLTYDQTGRAARLDGEPVELSAREVGLLEVFLLRPGCLVSKDPARQPPMRVGRRSLGKRYRGVRAPPAQEAGAGRRAHRHGARPGLQPAEAHGQVTRGAGPRPRGT